MTTSEELRTLVAEKVMGGKVYESLQDLFRDSHAAYPYFCPGYEYRPATVHFGQYVLFNYQAADRITVWNPLESWADAGRVIERMRELGFRLVLETGPADSDVMFVGQSGEGRFGKEVSENLKEAISLAALRALGVEVE